MALIDTLRVGLLCLLIPVNFTAGQRTSSRTAILKDPTNYYTTVEIACSEGYPAQEHKVVTSDGYVLTVHRIPRGRTRAKVPRRKNQYHKVHLHHHPDFDACVKESLNVTSTGPPVLFVHGVLMASDGWLLQGPGQDFAYILADNGYDVWLANVRGNFYSRKHLSLEPSDPQFWDFSFHENAVIDIPETIDYILKLTKKEKIGYVGLSMGTSIFFAMASARPEYNDKILGFIGLAPVAYMKKEYLSPRRRVLFHFVMELAKELKKRNLQEVFPRTTNTVALGMDCSQLQDICYDTAALFLGYHSKFLLRSKVHLYATHVPTGSSMKTFDHFIANFLKSAFKLYDYGSTKNVQMYGSPEPPDYPLWNITTPVALYFSDGDFFFDRRDIEDLRKVLPNVVDVYESREFNHADFLWAFNAKDILYNRGMAFFNKLVDQHNLQARRKKSVGEKFKQN